jgi:hypothetical protein
MQTTNGKSVQWGCAEEESDLEKERNLPEQFPVNTLLRRAGAAYKHNGANFAVLRADRQADL